MKLDHEGTDHRHQHARDPGTSDREPGPQLRTERLVLLGWGATNTGVAGLAGSTVHRLGRLYRPPGAAQGRLEPRNSPLSHWRAPGRLPFGQQVEPSRGAGRGTNEESTPRWHRVATVPPGVASRSRAAGTGHRTAPTGRRAAIAPRPTANRASPPPSGHASGSPSRTSRVRSARAPPSGHVQADRRRHSVPARAAPASRRGSSRETPPSTAPPRRPGSSAPCSWYSPFSSSSSSRWSPRPASRPSLPPRSPRLTSSTPSTPPRQPSPPPGRP